MQTISTLFTLMAPAIPAGNLAFPYHRYLKSSSPRMSMPDNKIKPGIFPGKVIIVEHGKLVRMDLPSIPPDYLPAVPPERGTTNRRLAWILTGYRGTFGT